MVPRGDGAPGVVQHLLTILVTHIYTHTLWESSFGKAHSTQPTQFHGWSGAVSANDNHDELQGKEKLQPAVTR